MAANFFSTTTNINESSMVRLPDQWKPADLLAFSGRGAISLTIKLATCSQISHVGGIGFTPRWQIERLSEAGVLRLEQTQLEEWSDSFLLYESTTLATHSCAITGRKVCGVQATVPDQRVHNYDGRVWLYRLTPEWLRDFEVERSTRLTGHLLARIGQQYDGAGAILSGTRVVKHFWAWRRVDRSSLFCSEYLAGVLQHVGLFPISNASKITPGSLIRMLVESEVYCPGVLIKS